MNNLIDIYRLTGSDGVTPTLGVMLIAEMPELVTLEPPWKENHSNTSCIPEGEYVCKRVYDRYTNGGMHIPVTFEAEDVEGRDGILFHVGNVARDTRGCILPGSEFGLLRGERAVLESTKAMDKFLNLTSLYDEFILYIHSLTEY